MSKKVWKISCIASILVFFAIVIRFAITLLQIQNGPSMGIIGGADAPTALFVLETRIFRNPLFFIALAAFALFVVSLSALLIKRFRKR